MEKLNRITDVLLGMSLTPSEAEALEAVIKTRTNATPATRADLDALAASTKRDHKQHAFTLAVLDARITALERLNQRSDELPDHILDLAKEGLKIEAELRDLMDGDHHPSFDRAALDALRGRDTRNERRIISAVLNMAREVKP